MSPKTLHADALELRELLILLGRDRSLRDPMAEAWAELDMTPPQIHTMIWLGVDGALTMGELARRLHVSEKTITGIVDRLERARYLHRERDESDRRVVRVSLTASGQKTYRMLDERVTHSLELMLGCLAVQDRADLFRILKRLLEAQSSNRRTATS